MPELPEVETVARQLAPLVRGRRICGVAVYDPLLQCTHPETACGCVITEVKRRGKQVAFSLAATPTAAPSLWLAVHLRMTGRLLFAPESAPPVERRHLRAWIGLDGGSIVFIDPRRFGTMRLVDNETVLDPGGMEPLSRSFTAQALAKLLAGARGPIKPWLLRQDRIVGLGNIYASETLFAARIHPDRRADTLTGDEIAALHKAIKSVLRRAVRNCGTTFSDFQDAHGVTGGYQRLLTVYGRQGQPCPVCATPVARLVQGQRSTFFCARCQR